MGFIKNIGLGKAGRVWAKLPGLAEGFQPPQAAARTPLTEVRGLADNPGNLRMFTYVPAELGPERPLVVVLHGCKQTAAGYDFGSGWSTLADRYGFALLFPQQQAANNHSSCFNWFEPDDTQRGRGEAASIRSMIEKIAQEARIDRRRIFVTGLSAGGAMTSALLACYPDVFAAGAIVAGLPYGTAQNVQQAFESMFQCPLRSAREWGELVRAAAPQHAGPWPRVSIWHGSADATVVPANAGEIVKQWTDVHGLQAAPSLRQSVDGYPREVWVNAAGDEIIEAYRITNLAHGTPLATGKSDYECGAVGPFFIEAGISSSYHIAKFFGITADGIRARSHAGDAKRAPEPHGFEVRPTRPQPPAPAVDPAIENPEAAAAAGFDVGAVINKALRAAGLIKERD